MFDEMPTSELWPVNERKLTRVLDSTTRDALTGLYNREALHVCLKHALSDPAVSVGVITIDLDYFKLFNDRKGDLAGDRVLVRISSMLGDFIRSGDIAARYGGEEFCILLADRNLADALEIAERLRLRIERELQLEGITASFGVATFPQHGSDPTLLLRAADNALYVSKRSGRNRVCKAAGWSSPSVTPTRAR